jgi:hypothetical protein
VAEAPARKGANVVVTGRDAGRGAQVVERILQHMLAHLDEVNGRFSPLRHPPGFSLPSRARSAA